MASGTLNKFSIATQIVSVGTVTIGTLGYVSIESFIPQTPAGFTVLACTLLGFGNASSHDAVNVTADGRYILGTAGATITNVNTKWIFYKP